MKLGRTWGAACLLALASVALPSCGRRHTAEVNDIVPSFNVNRARVPLGSAIEASFSFTVQPTAKKLTQDYRVFVHLLDAKKNLLLAESFMPSTATSAWETGKTYTDKRTIFIPIHPYVGDVLVVMGLYPTSGRGDRVALKGEDTGMLAYKVGKFELQPQTENIFLVYKDGWHSPEAPGANPNQERTWTKKEALVSFKNPKKDVVVYLEADTNAKAFAQPPVLTVTVGKAGVTIPIENSEVFLKKIRVKGEDLGSEDWTDLRLNMDQSFVPKLLTPPLNNDERELGLLVYHLYVGESDKLGELPPDGVMVAGALAPPAASKAAAKAPAKPAPAPKKS